MKVAVSVKQTNNIITLLNQLKTELGKSIDEIHLWDFSNTFGSRKTMTENSNLRRTSREGNGTYIPIHTPHDNKVTVHFKASSDAHILLSNDTDEYEIVLGGWNNTGSMLRHNKKDVIDKVMSCVLDPSIHKTFTVTIEENVLKVCGDNEIISYKLPNTFVIQEVFMKTGYGSAGDVLYETCENKGIFYMDKCDMNEFFNYYKEDVLYLDDTITFLDMNKFSSFVNSISMYDIILPTNVNTVVCEHFMKLYSIIPDVSETFINDYFISKRDIFLNENYSIKPWGDFFNIHCFVCNSNTWERLSRMNGSVEMRVKSIQPTIGISNFTIASVLEYTNYKTVVTPNVNQNKIFHYVTLATKPHPVLDLLQKTVQSKGEEITVLGLNENREIGQDLPNGKRRLGVKIKYLYDYLMNDSLELNDIVLFSDAYDVCYVGDQNTIIERFLKMDKPVVFGAELCCYPDESKASQYPPSPNGFRFLNSGLFIGRVYALRDCLKDYVFDDEENDQLWWTNTFLKRQDIMQLDYHNKLFLNCAFLNPSEITRNGDIFTFHGKTPQLIHGNGPSKPCIDPIIEYFIKKYL
jgi:hypothetical protein